MTPCFWLSLLNAWLWAGCVSAAVLVVYAWLAWRPVVWWRWLVFLGLGLVTGPLLAWMIVAMLLNRRLGWRVPGALE